ncbi:hypothetical protein F2P45_20975 [Massilia sp. CCM 8733]|uniref:Uncharacterized protein n=1 Tax=Massilia mucilaginosa TaxID=2609282 RepID=A0ABX0NXK7_9BURK|nr:hypothetical protein [Massilia mucilaginosa]NHZ91459.1 hypothetical protein [Massilia mucilaginosa]
MIITTEDIDSASMRPVGYAQLPSFVARFRSVPFSGVARLVPAYDNPRDCLDLELGVQITQGSVTDFRVIGLPAIVGADALDIPGSFKVCGILESQSPPSETGEGRYAFIAVGEASFCLSEQEMGGMWPEPESIVSFVAHDVTLWDEAL